MACATRYYDNWDAEAKEPFSRSLAEGSLQNSSSTGQRLVVSACATTSLK
jgi:hypothetical protein